MREIEAMLDRFEIDHFLKYGYVRIEQVFSSEVAAECRQILWRDIEGEPDDPASWVTPVVWLGGYHDKPFINVANSPKLVSAFDQLVGLGRWAPLSGLGTFPVRFPTDQDTGDTGWHIDASFPGEDDPSDFLSWRVNVHSKGRALLALFLFSNIDAIDAPTRIRAGSHVDIARLLAPAKNEGIAVKDLDYNVTTSRPEILATGKAGTVFICHPFLVHAAQINRGSAPRFIAQPPVFPKTDLNVFSDEGSEVYPIERAIRNALE